MNRKQPVYGPMNCADCGTSCERHSTQQRYCRQCSEKADLQRKRLWARVHPPEAEHRRRGAHERTSQIVEAGAALSTENRSSISWIGGQEVDLHWIVRLAVPFDWAFSKNHIWAMRSSGHVYMREEARAVRDDLTLRFRSALRGIEIFQAKLWLDIFVQKPNHKGDAMNVVDLVCDAVKDATGVDDRWYSLRRLDWEIVKQEPRIFVGLGQEATEHMQVCSYCGRQLPLVMFTKSKSMALGVGRECRECRAAAQRLRRSAE